MTYRGAMAVDRYDLPASTGSTQALEAYGGGVERLLTAGFDPDAKLREAVAEDPGFALAHAALARSLQLQARVAEARAAVAQAETLAQGASARERSHIAVLVLAINGKGAAALDALREHLALYPRDALALSLALGVYSLIGFSGRADHHLVQRALLESLAPRWPADGWFLGYLGWSEIETGEPARGSDTVERGLALKPRNAHAAHARAHGHVECGETERGLSFVTRWLDGLADPGGILTGHLNWHAALFELDLGQADRARERFRRRIENAAAPPMPLLADGASFLWRCLLYGLTDPAPDWTRMRTLTEATFAKSGLPFADLHAAMVEAATGAEASLDRRIAELEQRAADGALPPGGVVPRLCRGLRAYGRGDFEAAIAELEPALPELDRVGGSHAQRDVFEETLVAACLHAGRAERARALLAVRSGRRPGAQDRRWSARAGTA